jgi:signal peptidase I
MKHKRKKSELQEWIEAIVITLILAIILRSFVFVFARVEGTSMLDTLHEGDRLLVSKITYHFTEPEYGDIVIIDVSQSIDDYVKRIIGKAGDTIEIKNNTVYRNGTVIDEPYLIPRLAYPDFHAVTVPEDCYFVLGDNRPVSQDSRYASVGFIAEDDIDGKIIYRVWPLDNFNSPYKITE